MISEVSSWIRRQRQIKSAVLFGSTARSASGLGKPDRWSDIDLHIITSDLVALTNLNWDKALPHNPLCLFVVRPATGGVQKATAVFEKGQVDLVLVPEIQLMEVEQAFWNGTYIHNREFVVALNEMATCLHAGFQFKKGKNRWSRFYNAISKLPGVRIGDACARNLADIFLCDLLWIFQKLERGELIAAQHFLHTKLVDTNLRLWREIELRRGAPLISFGLGRRLEELHGLAESQKLRVNAYANYRDLHKATEKALRTLISLMNEILPQWRIGRRMGELIENMSRGVRVRPITMDRLSHDSSLSSL